MKCPTCGTPMTIVPADDLVGWCPECEELKKVEKT